MKGHTMKYKRTLPTIRRLQDCPQRRGAALVEAAMVLPVFFLAILGIMEFGRAMMVSQLVTNASREAARRSVMDGSTNLGVETYIKDRLASSVGAAAADFTVAVTITPDPSNTTTGNNLVDAQPYDLVTVDVSVPYDTVSYFTGTYLNGKIISAQTTMRHE